MAKDITDYEVLADGAELGDLKRGPTVYRGDGSEIDLASMFVPVERPRTEEENA